ncbi:hypothetical protein FQN57_001906 [Myotisia sp. PD_48]|nr:hypothetical protein FQN57_001906 [Myotisia sp. PD_48]
MDTLPQEIIDRIVWFAGGRELATVSRIFQCSVEKDTFSRYICSTNSSMQEFLAKYRGRRWFYLRYITFTVDFPFLIHTEENPLKCRETKEDLQAHNERFTCQLLGLFKALKSLEQETPRPRTTNIELSIKTPFQDDDENMECHHRRYHSWRLCLLDPQRLPILSSIHTLTFGEPYYRGSMDKNPGWSDDHLRPLDFGIVPALLPKLPKLQVLNGLPFYERFPEAYEYSICRYWTRPWEGPWRDTRHAFGNIMMENADALPAKLQRVHIEFGQSYKRRFNFVDQSVPLPDLVKPSAFDPLSSALRVLSQPVVSLEIKACVDGTLFWPSSDDPNAKPPHWQHLKYLRIEFLPVSPSGVWYFQGPRGEGRETSGFKISQTSYPPLEENEEDERMDEIWAWEWGRFENFNPNQFRIVPTNEIIEPFLEAFVKAMKNMPQLESAELFSVLDYYPGEDLQRKYGEEELDLKRIWGVKCSLPKDDSCPILEWRVGNWRPSRNLQQSFYDIWRHRGGKPLEEKWVEEKWLSWDFFEHRAEPAWNPVVRVDTNTIR